MQTGKLKMINIISAIYLFLSLAFCFRLDKYNKVVQSLQDNHLNDLQILAANNGEAVIMFLLALVLVICAIPLFILLIKYTCSNGESVGDWVLTILLLILIIIAVYFIIHLIYIPIFKILLRVVLAGGVVLGIITSSD
ncbi:hypothetical protein [Limosilactobacillus fastidiosus]|uniref:Uncharacterized protein n=1 Tax=Limosilactobacillus fastidiosus TaxID=2759855 RepID=A0A7W3TY39_9LACO|nr:hypothetical protein [Limosilactobacillus fastidiosus]MBB1063207.1 hypothetical protein [Limosilactobacillus fastidiosus]MBB1085377.1 hypothetical protein [Limosilactobacillus fastidiosus]MCD7083679.1 hypothetical protein [Limosilactobacillus fastidiosus]MCD7085359.1 hypothetical protein [Limosilactobacillus fastidiosus]MCD7114876.1 hypothetical protein [Limosilactobacillus fastidiosus]